ncbi:MAG: hypothetical protein LQ351_006375 [Letrouitia transgressa]|nr:MAG: hypothetical protein LQ351_006375 [Letrouitia transgressa]
MRPQDFYIAYNIYSLNIFFSTWSQAVGDAGKAVEDQISDILLALDLPQSGLKDDLSSNLQDLTQLVQSKLQLTLTSVESDAEEFLAFVTVGSFSESSPSLLDATNDFMSAMATYLTTLALTKSDIYVTIGKNTSVSELATNGTQLAYPIDCAQGLDPQGVCDAWWWSDKYQSSFGLVNRNTPSEAYGPKISKLLSLGFTTGQLLFDNAYACPHPVGTPVDVNVTAAGVNTPCWSIIDVYAWDMACHADPTAVGDDQANCEFEGSSKEPSFWGASGTTKSVPNSYLGPAIAQNIFKISRA